MTELVTAVFETPSSAEAAINDLKVARIPSAVVQRGSGGSALHQESSAIWPQNAANWQRPLVRVVVDEIHAGAVTGILEQHGPPNIEEREAQSHRR